MRDSIDAADGETFVIVVRPEGDGPPAIHRVRRLLKIALRACRLRCVGVESVGSAGPRPPVGSRP